MSQVEEEKRRQELKEWRRQHMEPSGRRVHNAMIDVQIQAYREAIEFLEKRIAELESDKIEEQA